MLYHLLNFLVGFFPGGFVDWVQTSFYSRVSLLFSNVPGRRKEGKFCGSRIKNMFPWVPMLASGSLGVLCYTYAGQLTLTIQADPINVSDPNLICSIFVNECQKMIEEYEKKNQTLSKAEEKV